MKILIAPDKFKGGQTAREAAENMAAGIGEILPEAELQLAPIADGGEGTAEVIGEALSGTWRACAVHDALNRPITSRYVWLPGRETAVMEMSATAGLKDLRPEERNVERATTTGVGEMMLEAMKHGAREIIIGLGGSATNDGGVGLARALGFRFFDSAGVELQMIVSDLRNLARIDVSGVGQRTRVIAATDVRNPLLGDNGATRMFGPQKGASADQLCTLEDALKKLADVVARDFGTDFRSTPGAGAAGGLGFGLMSFCGATVRSGFEVVSEAIGLEEKMRDADMVVTGEGSLDRQSLEGKAPAELARLARKLGKRVFAIVGRTDGDARLKELFDGIYVIADPSRSERENIANAAELTREGGRLLARALR